MWDCIVDPMSERAHASSTRGRLPDEQTDTSRATLSHTGGAPAPDLQLDVVTYDDGPDRGTIHPPDLTGIERMETWMSVDLSVVADLSVWR